MHDFKSNNEIEKIELHTMINSSKSTINNVEVNIRTKFDKNVIRRVEFFLNKFL